MKECPVCKRKIKHLNARHIKNCFGEDSNYKYRYIIHNFPSASREVFFRLYEVEKWSTNMLRDHFSMDLKSVCYLLNYYGIQIRTIKDTRNLKEYKERIESTNIERYGAINPLSTGTLPFRKRNQTVKDKYGCENVFQRLDLFVENWSNFGKNGKISSLNKLLFKILDELGTDFKPEHSISYYDESGKKRWKSYDALVGNLLIEVNGDYWHANPLNYKEDDVFYFPKSIVKAKEIWELDIYKKKIAELHGYKFMTVWESELKESINDVKQRIKDKVNQKD